MDDLSPKQIISIGLLCEGLRQAAVAAQMKIRVETLRRWAKDPIYKAALFQGRAEVWRDAISEASAHVSTALATLQHIFIDPEMPASSRVNAAARFIELTRPPVELTQDGLAEGDRAQVIVMLPDNNRGDYTGATASRSELTEED